MRAHIFLCMLAYDVKWEMRQKVAGQKIVFEKMTRPTSLQRKALDLLGVSLMCTQ